MRERPHFGNRPQFAGTADDYEWLARWFGYRANVIPVWKGSGTVLLVLSKGGEPLTLDEVREFRTIVVDWSVVGADVTVVSVG